MEIVTLHLMRGLKESGYEVRCIFCGWNDGQFKKKLDEAGIVNYPVKIGWIYIRKPLWTMDTLIHYPSAYFNCKKIIKEFSPDICQFCNFAMSIMLYPLIKKNSIYGLHETYYPNLKSNAIFRVLNKKIKYFTGVSNHIVHVLSALGIPQEKIKLIYNGIPIPENQIFKEAFLFDNGPIHFAIIGQLVSWKGHGILVEAIEMLLIRKINNFKVLIYGNEKTEFGIELKKLIERKELVAYFVWKGFVSDQDKIYEDADVVLVPSLSAEPCSMTIIESMARGKAVIASDRGGNPELVQDGVNGMVFKDANSMQLAVCMEYLLKNKSKIKEFGNAAKTKADLHYSYLNMTDGYIDLYNKC